MHKRSNFKFIDFISASEPALINQLSTNMKWNTDPAKNLKKHRNTPPVKNKAAKLAKEKHGSQGFQVHRFQMTDSCDPLCFFSRLFWLQSVNIK